MINFRTLPPLRLARNSAHQIAGGASVYSIYDRSTGSIALHPRDSAIHAAMLERHPNDRFGTWAKVWNRLGDSLLCNVKNGFHACPYLSAAQHTSAAAIAHWDTCAQLSQFGARSRHPTLDQPPHTDLLGSNFQVARYR